MSHRDVLIEQLWPEADPAVGANNFHQALHAARRVVGAENLVLQDEIVVLGGADSVTVDVDEFDAAAARAASTGAPEDIRDALALWSGELLPEDLYEDWAAPHRDRLERDSNAPRGGPRSCTDGRTDCPTRPSRCWSRWRWSGRSTRTCIGRCWSRWLRAGRRWDAAAAFERLRDGLAESYGVAPAPETTAVYRRLFVGGAPDPGTCPHNLPTMSTSFVGRHRELAELGRLLERTRLLTLTGPGGAGKTRLAVEIAHGQVASARWADGVWLVELAGVTQGDGVPSAVGGALELPLEGNRPWIAALVDQLASRAILLILDNCEHVLDAVVPLAAELLARCPDLVIVATSREPLGLPGEIAWRVPSLELPGDDDAPDLLARLESVQLFVERARHASPSFVLDAATAGPVAEICRRLDGIPLALELAAVRVVHLSVAQLSARLGDALAVLSRRGRGHPDRQQTLAATLDWSHDLLLDDERVAFRRLAVFAGGFDLDAAAAVTAFGDVIDVLSRLVDKSLVTAETTGEAVRFGMLEVVRQYAEAQLRDAGELAACVERHRAWYAQEAARHDPDRGVPVVLEPPAVVRRRDGQPARRVRERVRRATVPGPPGRRQHVPISALAGSAGRSPGLAHGCPRSMPGGLGAADARPVHQGGAASSSRRPRAGGGRGPRHHRGLEGSRRRRDGHRPRSRVDLHVDDPGLAGREATIGDGTLRRPGSQPAITVGARHFAAVLALALGRGGRGPGSVARGGRRARPCARGVIAVLHHVDRVVRSSTTAEPCRSPSPRRPCCSAGVVGAAQARGHLAVAAALAERLAGRTDLALALLDDAIARFTALGDTFGIGYALGQRGHTLRWAGDLAGALACFDAAEQVHRSLRDLRSIAMAVAGRSYVAALLGEATDRPPPGPRSGVDDGTDRRHRRRRPHPQHPGAHRAGARRRRRRPATAGADPAPGRPGVTPIYAIGWEYLLVAHLRHASATPTHRLVPPPRRRHDSTRSAIGEVNEPCKERAKRVPSRCRPDHDSERGRHDTATRRRDHQRARGGAPGLPRAARRR